MDLDNKLKEILVISNGNLIEKNELEANEFKEEKYDIR